MKRSKSKGIAETIRTVFFAVIIAMTVRTFGYEPFNIPSGSMIPTLLIGDYLFVSKFSYGYSKHSLPFSLPLISDRIFFTEPERGDVAVFKLPYDNATDYIKRIIGLPGDTVQVTSGILKINGTRVDRVQIEDFVIEGQWGTFHRTPQFEEILPNGKKHAILEESDTDWLDNTPQFLIPEGHYFVMGNNRDRSKDSRVMSSVGFIPKDNLVGRAEFLFFSINGSVWEFWNWPKSIRFQRIFKSID